jgi:hypothetical protein
VVGKVEVTINNKKKETVLEAVPAVVHSIILNIEDVWARDQRSILMEHFAELPDYFGQIKTDKFDKEQTEELLESIAQGMHAEKITGKVSFDVK